QAGGFVASAASYGQPERAAASVMPDGSPARQRAFRFNLPRPRENEPRETQPGVEPGAEPERCAFQIIARTEDGFEYAEDYAIALDATAPTPVSIISGPTRLALASGARPHVVMYIERGTIDIDGILSVQGWAVSLGSISTVQIFAGETRTSNARMDRERTDVAKAFPAYPSARLSGFNLTVQLDPADLDAETIRARIECPNGFAHEQAIPVERVQRRGTPPRPPADQRKFADDPSLDLVPSLHVAGVLPSGQRAELAADQPEVRPNEVPPEIRMFCDAATLTGDGTLSVKGWAVCRAGIAQVRVMLNASMVGLASFGHERLDVGEKFPDIAMAQLSGFRFTQQIDDLFKGEHKVRVIVRDLHNNEKEKQLSVVATLLDKPPPPVERQVSSAPELTAEQAAEFRFELDAPALANGTAIETVAGRLTIDGWLLTQTGVAAFEVFLDGLRLGNAHYGLARQDVGAAFPDTPNALRSGYAFHCPPHSLRDGEHKIELKIRANSGQELVHSFRITVKNAGADQDIAGIRRRVPRVEADLMSGILADADYRPSFQLILRQDRSIDISRLSITFNALRLQPYLDWTMVILAEDDDVATATQIVVNDLIPHLADRISILTPSNADAWIAPLASASNCRTTLHALLLPGDELSADAMLELAVAGGRRADRELIYGDEVRISPVSNEREPFFKPDFSPDLLYSTNYIGRPWVATAALLARSGATPASLTANGEYDLVLRCAELATAVHHIPKLLCQRAALALDDPDREKAALEGVLQRRGIAAEVLATPIPGTWRVKRTVASTGKVSIIIPTCAAHGYIETCITTLRAKTAYSNFEIICVDNIQPAEIAWKIWLRQRVDKVVEIPDAFNWSAFNNRAARVADGEFLLFLNDDIEITQED
ncbi:MAG: hypothetical protein QOF90_808, partial [Acetobacteraceae bacterium]|nr:hypothetical protein [Acetobacteraceae bacterium]